jgi:secreted trypsin-like serine protease
MSAFSLRHAMMCAALGVLASQPPLCLAITGGVSVDEVLASGAGSGYTAQQVAFARAVSAVTVPLFILDATGRPAGLCSATIVHPRVVLTAAHCVMNGREVSRKMTVGFEQGRSRRQALDAIVHPAYLKQQRSSTRAPETQSARKSRRSAEPSSLSADLALVLLHRQIPETHAVVAPVSQGFRDDRTLRKFIAGFGHIDGYRSLEALSLHFAEVHGNSRTDEGAISGEGEIIMESRYRDGARVSTCAGDSGGPVFVLERGTSRLRQLAVTSAGDKHCRQMAVFAPIDSQRTELRDMFDALMRGEQNTEQNPF